MHVFTTSKSVRKYINQLKHLNFKVGFVPTMGALHDGHASLIKKCKTENDICVVSIFVNPTQFNNKSDLDTYPSTIIEDKMLLNELNCDVLFLPNIKDIYPKFPKVNLLHIDLGKLNTTLEAAHRPGHFEGVVTVVDKLFNAVPANYGYFGKKDFQQILVIKKLVFDKKHTIKIIACNTIREKDGLAMSSRNVKLSKTERLEAGNISKALTHIKDNYIDNGILKSINEAEKIITHQTNFKIEYLKVVNSKLDEVSDNKCTDYLFACTAVYAGKTRLIDNLKIN